MALNDFKQDYILRYQDILSKVMVGLKIASTRFESNLKFGDTVNRTILDLSAVRVRAYTDLSDQTIDPLTDSEETMTVTLRVGAVFPISRGEKIQAGPMNPAELAGKEIAIKVANYLDAHILTETRNAFATFDNGNLTSDSSSGTKITLSNTTVPQMVAMTRAKLFSNNVSMANITWVLDPYSVAQIAQFPIGKDITSANTTFVNGFSGTVYGADIHTSNNLTAELLLTSSGAFVDTQTIVIGGITFTSMTTLGSTAGNFAIGASQTESHANLAALLNAPSTTNSTQVALSAANQIKLVDVLGIGTARSGGVTVTATATTNVIVAVGSSRITVSETQSNVTFTHNFIHAYFGMKGAIDVAIQDQPTVEMRDEAKQLTTNIFNNVVAAIKTFTDGKQKFLDVHILNA